MNFKNKIISSLLILSLTGCSSVPHNKALIYDKTLNAEDTTGSSDPTISVTRDYKSKEIERIIKNSETKTIEECEIEKNKDLENVLKILNNESIEKLIKKENENSVIYENKQFKVYQSKCYEKKDKLYAYQMFIDSKTKASVGTMERVKDVLIIVALSPILLVMAVVGGVVYVIVNSVLYLEKVASEP